MKKWKKTKITLLVIVGLLAVFAVIVALQPADFKIVRVTTIAAPAGDVFAHVNDLHRWEAWSPWVKLDPNMKTTYSGPAAGEGAAYAWSGNDKVGEGKMTIIKTVPNQLVQLRLDFEKPMKDTCTVDIALSPSGPGTNVSWTMSGHKNFVGKAFCLFMDMDKMVGGDFERGLATLKVVTEARPVTATAASAPSP